MSKSLQQFSMQTVLERLKELGIRPNKKLGQNFLVNVEVCKKIVVAAQEDQPSCFIEIGPGLGALTEFLLESGAPLTLIELDRIFVQYWQGRGLNVLHEDALKLDWSTLDNPAKTCLISNLPYQISSSIVIDRSIQPFSISKMVLMFQKEVGQRLTAKNKTADYGLLTVLAQTFWHVELLMDVGPKDFYPPPQVASRVLVFKRKEANIEKPQKYLTMVKVAFAQRRKFMASNLSQLHPKEKVLSALQSMGIKDTVRAEELTVEQFIDLYNKLKV